MLDTVVSSDSQRQRGTQETNSTFNNDNSTRQTDKQTDRQIERRNSSNEHRMTINSLNRTQWDKQRQTKRQRRRERERERERYKEVDTYHQVQLMTVTHRAYTVINHWRSYNLIPSHLISSDLISSALSAL